MVQVCFSFIYTHLSNATAGVSLESVPCEPAEQLSKKRTAELIRTWEGAVESLPGLDPSVIQMKGETVRTLVPSITEVPWLQSNRRTKRNLSVSPSCLGWTARPGATSWPGARAVRPLPEIHGYMVNNPPRSWMTSKSE